MTIIIEDIKVKEATRERLNELSRSFCKRCGVIDGIHAIFLLEGHLIFFSDFAMGMGPFREWQRWTNPDYILENENSLIMGFQLYLSLIEKQIFLQKEITHQ